jgi:arylsulfatase A-like enzyme
MTGQHTGHSVIRGNKFSPLVGVVPLNDDIITLPEAIKNKTNYTTAMCGRWHLGGELTNQTPFNRGFDYHFGKLSSDYGSKAGVMIDQLWDENGKHIPYERYSKLHIEPMYENGRLLDLTEKEIAMRPINMDELVTEKAVRYIKEKRENPFFLYIAFSLVHEPMEYHEKYPVSNHKWPEKERAFASMLQTLDSYIGKILSAVDVAGIQNNTVIIFTSDNGAHNEGGHNVEFFNSNGNFREYKRSLHEGGIRSPMIVRWPGVVKRGITSKHISAFWDIMPTLCNIAGAPIPSQTDGISFLPVLEGKETEQPKHDYLYWEFNESINFKKGQYKQAVREDDWKGIYYIDNNQFELYDLKNDITEENNVANQNPEIVQNLKQIMRIAHINSDRFPLLKEERGVK